MNLKNLAAVSLSSGAPAAAGTTKPKIDPIAPKLSADPFILQHAGGEKNPVAAIKAAFNADPGGTLLLLLSSYKLRPVSVCRLLGFSKAEDIEVVKTLISKLKTAAKVGIVQKQIEPPEELVVEYHDSDGLPQKRDIAGKFKRALTAALFDKKNPAVMSVSVQKGIQATYNLNDLLDGKLEDQRRWVRAEYARMFPVKERQAEGNGVFGSIVIPKAE